MSIDAAALKSRGTYASNGPLPALLGDLTEIEITCGHWKAYRKRVFRISTVLLIAGLIAIFSMAVHTMMSIVFLGLLMVAAAIAGFIHGTRFARLAVPHMDRCAVVRDIAGAWRDDTSPKQPMSVQLSMAENRTLKTKGPWTARKKGEQKFFEDGWLSIASEFLDGTKVSLGIAELTRERTFVTSRGKWKTKRRSRHLFSVRFQYPPETYGDATRVPEKLQLDLKVEPGTALRDVKVSGKSVKVKALVSATRDLAGCSKMVSLGVYRILNASRRIAGPAKQGGGQ
jgi:hypothetical protein